MTTPKKQTGNQGETLAAQYLEKKGYLILDKNWRCKTGELDIVACKDKVLVFVEVKTCRASTVEAAFMQITPAKRRKLIASVYYYLSTHSVENLLPRIDVVGIALPYDKPPVIEHLEEALDW